MNDLSISAQSIVVSIRRSKTSFAPAKLVVRCLCASPLCPVHCLTAYIAQQGLSSMDSLFPFRRVKDFTSAIATFDARLSGHSGRRTAAQLGRKSSMSLESIKLAGRWKSAAVEAYFKADIVEAFSNVLSSYFAFKFEFGGLGEI